MIPGILPLVFLSLIFLRPEYVLVALVLVALAGVAFALEGEQKINSKMEMAHQGM